MFDELAPEVVFWGVICYEIKAGFEFLFKTSPKQKKEKSQENTNDQEKFEVCLTTEIILTQ